MSLYPIANDVATPARQAALLLHAMPPADRMWSLEQLAPAHREQLVKWIRELEELGIPRDRRLIDDVLPSALGADEQGTNNTITPPHAHSAAIPQLGSLDAAAVRVLVSILRHEPARLLAILLAQGPWSWEPDLLAQLPPGKRSQIESLRQKATGEHRVKALAQAVLDKTAEHLHSALERSLDQPPQSTHRALRGHPPRWLSKVFSSMQDKGPLA